MKIGILTYYGVHNHGAVLQANALRTYLRKKGHTVYFLSFERNYDYIPPENAKKYKGGLASLPFYSKYLIEKGLSNILYNVKKTRVLNTYRKSRLPVIESFDKFDGDMIIIGSDEVFSLEIGYNPCLYGIGLKSKKIISYAGCFGPTTVDDIKSKKLASPIAEGLNKMTAISVRDGNSKSVVEQLTDREAILVCDPVIMYGYKKEMSLFTPNDRDYIVIYAYDRSMQDPKEIAAIKAFAKRHHKKIYSVAYHHNWCDKNIQANPNQLLGWIKYADCVITDTFHGSVLSIVCNTPMIVKLRENKNKLEFLLQEFELKDRIISKFEELDSVYKRKVDFSKVNVHINERRKASRSFLDEFI